MNAQNTVSAPELDHTPPDLAGPLLTVAREARSSYRRVFEGPAEDVVRLPEGAAAELIQAVARTVRSSVRQIVPFSSFGAELDFSHQVWRTVATPNSGIEVQRLYVVPPGGDPARMVDRQIQADRQAGAESRRLDLGTSRETSPWRLAADIPLAEVWLIDDCAVVRRELSDHSPPVWVVSTRAVDLRRARTMWRLWETPPAAHPGPDDPVDLTEPLLESASMIRAMAPMSCTRDHVDRVSCSWYHGTWQYLRLFDMVSSPSWHSAFYQKWLAAGLAGAGPSRVLITGTADYSVLAYVIAAARSVGKIGPDGEPAGPQLNAHVMDLCPTPLNACRWYADRFQLDIKLHEADILDDTRTLVGRVCGDAKPEQRFDLIATDAFLTRFSRDELDRVLDNWKALLRPGGYVVTTVRLHPREETRQAGAVSGVPQDLLRFSLRLRERALVWGGSIGLDLEDLLGAARRYTLKMTSTNIGDLHEIVELVQRHGFKVVTEPDRDIETGSVDGELVPTEYARLVLTTV
jgi:hypothetical protein